MDKHSGGEVVREIKFRGISNYDSVFVYGDLQRDKYFNFYITELTDEGLTFDVDSETIGQYTGLKDRNGKEIYEGDIVKNTIGKLEKVVFNQGAFKTQSINHPNANLYLLESYIGYIEVIGNIYENREGLNE